MADLYHSVPPVRCSAMTVSPGRVRVLFRRETDRVMFGFTMPAEVYAAIPRDSLATPVDYAELGTITPAPNSFDDVYRRAI